MGIILGTFLFCYRKHRNSPDDFDGNLGVVTPGVGTLPGIDLGIDATPFQHGAPHGQGEGVRLYADSPYLGVMTSSHSSASTAARVPTSSVATMVVNQNSPSNQLSHPAEVEATTRTLVAPSFVSPAGTSLPMSARLTEDQSELLQGLIRQNIPLPAVVGVMEGMLREGGHLEGDAPPDYSSI